VLSKNKYASIAHRQQIQLHALYLAGRIQRCVIQLVMLPIKINYVHAGNIYVKKAKTDLHCNDPPKAKRK